MSLIFISIRKILLNTSENMASDLYRDVLKEKDNMGKSNPRTRSFGGGLSSSDNDYKNYLAGMRPRTKSNNTKPINTSFVDSAARKTQNSTTKATNGVDSKQLSFSQKGRNKSDSSLDKDDSEKKKQYSELSSVPFRRSVDSNSKTDAIINEKSKSDGIDFASLKQTQSDLAGSVGRLRSMFDKSTEAENKPVVQLRSNKGRKERPYSASFDPVDQSKPKVSGNYDRHSMHISPLQVDSIVAMNGKDQDQVNGELSEESEDDKPSKIDVDSILAPEEPNKSEEVEIKEDEDTSKNVEIELKKQLDIERMKRTQEEMQIEQRFNIKRRTLKEKLSDLAGGSESNVSSYVAADPIINKAEKIAPPVATKPDAKHHQPLKEIKKFDDEKINQIAKKEGDFETRDDVSIDVSSAETSKDTKETKNYSNEQSPVNTSELRNTNVVQETIVPAIKMEIGTDKSEKLTEPQIEVTTYTNDLKSKENPEESEIDKYRSAVERFDDFINKQENLFGLDEDDPLKDFPNDFTPEDSSKLFNTEISTETKKESLSGNLSSSPPAENNPSDLMNSILSHMEKSKSESSDYVSLLRSSSQESDGKSPKLPSDIAMPLVSPEAPPRLSKLQGRSTSLPSSIPVSTPAAVSPSLAAAASPSPIFVEDSQAVTQPVAKPEKHEEQPQRPSSLSISTKSSIPNSVSSTISYMPGESESESEESGSYSVNSSDYYNNNTNGYASENYVNYHQSPSVDSESESFKLPPPPAKSNLKKSKRDKKRRVNII